MAKASGKEIRAAVAYWRKVLDLEDWSYTVRIGRMAGGDYGSAEVDVPYKRVRLTFSPQGMHANGETVDGMALHEWLHCLVEPLAAKALSLAKTDKDREIVGDLEEGLTTDLERRILRLHKRPGSTY